MARDGAVEYPAAETKWLADRIRGARFVSSPGDEHLFVLGNQDDLLDGIERFVIEVRSEEAALDRVLATVMFTDMVVSTEKAAGLGDKGWRDLVERHHGVVRAMLGRFRGIEVDTAPSEVLVSHTVQGLVSGSGLQFEDAGEHELKGIPDRWRLYRLIGT